MTISIGIAVERRTPPKSGRCSAAPTPRSIRPSAKAGTASPASLRPCNSLTRFEIVGAAAARLSQWTLAFSGSNHPGTNTRRLAFLPQAWRKICRAPVTQRRTIHVSTQSVRRPGRRALQRGTRLGHGRSDPRACDRRAGPYIQKVDCAVGAHIGPLGACIFGDDHPRTVVATPAPAVVPDDAAPGDGCASKSVNRTDAAGNSETRTVTRC